MGQRMMGTTPMVAMAEKRPSTTADVDACILQLLLVASFKRFDRLAQLVFGYNNINTTPNGWDKQLSSMQQ